MKDVKLRLGTMNTAGMQKGVDSLLVTDLIKLSQNRAISDAVLLTGDEDMRVGVQLAQEYGIRVHLLGIDAQGMSHSSLLTEEVDTVLRLPTGELEKVFARISALPTSGMHDNLAVGGGGDLQQPCDVTVEQFIQQMRDLSVDIGVIAHDIGDTGLIPSEYDRILLGIAKNVYGKFLDQDEKAQLRARLRERLEG